MDHVGVEAQVAGGLDDRPGEEGKALGVVIVAVDVVAFEVVLVVHEVVGDPVLFQLKQAAVGGAPGQVDVEALQVGHLVPPLLADALVEGEDDPHIVAHLGQGLGQGARHVGQTAGLDKGGHLRGCKKDIHKYLPIPFFLYTISSLAMTRG